MKILRFDSADPNLDVSFHYHGYIGKLNFLKKNTFPYIFYADHQCAKFYKDPRAPRGTAVKIWSDT